MNSLVCFTIEEESLHFQKALSDKIMMGATYVILNFLMAAFLKSKKQSKKGEINFNNIFYLAQFIQNSIISKCN